MSKPTIIIVPGAWHVPEQYKSVTSYLKSQGYPVICNQNLSTGGNDASKSNIDDAAAIRKTIDSVSGDVILAMHSYGGQPGSEAAVGAPNVIGLLFIAAFVVPPTKSINFMVYGESELPGPDSPDLGLRLDMEKGTITHSSPRPTMYQDLDDETAAEMEKQIKEQTIASFATPNKDAAWTHLPKVYILTTNDMMLLTVAQEKMVEMAGNWLEVKRLATGHTPWLAKQDEFNQALGGAVELLIKAKSQK